MKLSLVVDMYGCPNRCKHCWLGHMPNKTMEEDTDLFLIDYFRPYFNEISYYSWSREPDFTNDYRARWKRDCDISINSKPLRFELASFYKIVREPDYVQFLKEVNTNIVQLTFFGLEKLTDKYVGRNGAFKELLKATDILLNNGIGVRWQAFINEENKDEIVKLLELSKELNLDIRSNAINKEFKFFVHSGSCDGENAKLYHLRINKKDIPTQLIPYFLEYDTCYEEKELFELLKNEETFINFPLKEDIVLYVSNNYDIYFNYSSMIDTWKIGNVKEEDSSIIFNKIINQDVYAINVAKNVKIKDLVKECGDFTSEKEFNISDYKFYLLFKYLLK